MYIAPNTDIYILKDVPLDPTYEHSIYFDNDNAQVAYFTKKIKFRLNAQSYTNPTDGSIRVEIPADKLYGCNYLMFRNSSFGSKWFYAFVNNVRYINNVTSELSFSLDPLQTWNSGYKLTTCFIERQHPESDNYGEHLIDEGLDIGDVTSGKFYFGSGWDDYSVCVVSAFDADELIKTGEFKVATGGYYSRLYSGLSIVTFPCKDSKLFSDLNLFLSKVIEGNRSTSVINVFMCPTFMVQPIGTSFTYELTAPKGRSIDIEKPYGWAFSYANGNGQFIPKNNKLYNYPYCSLMVTNGDGDSKLYKWEDFYSNSNMVEFWETFVFNAVPSASTSPTYYKTNQAYRTEANRDTKRRDYYRLPSTDDEALIMNDFPVCAFSVDSYRAWLAQKKATLPYEIGRFALSQLGLNASANTAAQNALQNTAPYAPYQGDPYGLTAGMAGGVGGLLGGQVTPKITGRQMGAAARAGLAAGGAQMLVNTAGFVLDQMKEFRQAEFLPEGTNGTISGNGFSSALRLKKFTYTHRMIKAEYAMMIDAYFTMFGYKLNRIGTPNRTARPHWTYLKTTNCQLVPIGDGLPSDDAQFITEIYNHGITWWRNGDEIGNYALDNKPR